MTGISGYPASAQWAEMPEEAIARAEEQMATLATETGGFLADKSWLIFVLAVIAVVGLMLLYLAGRYRRERAVDDGQTAPLFDEATATAGQEDSLFGDDVSMQGFAETIGDDGEPEAIRSAFAEHEIAQPINGAHEQPAMSIDDDATKAETLEADIADLEVIEPEAPVLIPEPEEPPRYAFATGRPEGEANATFVRPTPEREPDLRSSLKSTAASVREGSDGGAYIAPFIRDDIDRSEKRQSNRVESLRDEMAREVQTLKNEQSSRLDLVIAAIDRKLESLDKRQAHMLDAQTGSVGDDVAAHVTGLGEKVERISSAIDGQDQRMRAITTILENRFAEVGLVHEEIKSVHAEVVTVRLDMGKTTEAVGSVRSEMDEVKEQIGRLERAILDRAAQDSATTSRLTDVIKGTLPEGTYIFAETLANGETADCLVSFDGLREKIAIDAGFPMEAFHELPSRDAVRRNLPQAKASEDAFRRAILRAILEAADRCISPAETADSCLLFLPSEAAYTILHDRFPDLVRDSQRARVWLVSPSTLMGTLNLIQNLLPDREELELRSHDAEEATAKRDEDRRLREEVDLLRRRASGLADELDRTRGTLRDLITSAEKISPMEEISSSRTDEYLSAPAVDDGIIDGLRFDGTPDWSGSPSREERSSSQTVSPLFDDDRSDPLR